MSGDLGEDDGKSIRTLAATVCTVGSATAMLTGKRRLDHSHLVRRADPGTWYLAEMGYPEKRPGVCSLACRATVVVALVAGTLFVASAPVAAGPVLPDPPVSLGQWGTPGTGPGQFGGVGPALAVDGVGNVYVADTGNDRIQKFGPNGSFLRQWGQSGTGNGQFSEPEGIAVDDAGNVFVSDTGNDRIQRFTGNGAFVSKWGSSGTGNGAFDEPMGMDVLGTSVYVADKGNARIQVFTMNGTWIESLAAQTYLPGQCPVWCDPPPQLVYPIDVAAASSSYVLFVDGGTVRANIANQEIEVVKPQLPWGGEFAFSFAWAIEYVDGRLYVAERNSDGISVVNGGWYWFSFGAAQLDDVSHVAVGPGGIVYASDGNSRVQRFGPPGAGVAGTVTGQITEDGSGEPIAGARVVALDSGYHLRGGADTNAAGDYQLTDLAPGDYFLAFLDPSGDHIQEFHDDHPSTALADADPVTTTAGEITTVDAALAPTSTPGTIEGTITEDGGGPLAGVWAVAISATNGQPRASATTDAVGDYAITDLVPGAYLMVFIDPTGFHHPEYHDDKPGPSGFSLVDVLDGQTVGVDASLAVVSGAEVPPADFAAAWGATGSADGEFDGPRGVTADASAGIFVTDTGNDRVQRFSASGTFETKWGTTGSSPGQLNGPSGVAVNPAGIVGVADTGNDRVNGYTTEGTFSGQLPSPLNAPAGLAINMANDWYVADTGSHRVVRDPASGDPDQPWGTFGTGDGQFDGPAGVATDAAGNVYVADTGNDRIQVFTNAGVYLTQWGATGTGDGQFDGPAGVATDAAGNVYVADTGNDRIQKFTNAGAAVSGTVTDHETGTPLEGVQVVVLDASYQLQRGAVTDPTGAYEIAGLGPGAHYLAFLDSTGDHAMEFHDGHPNDGLVDADPVVLTEGQNTTVDTTLTDITPNAVISGTVSEDGGGPIEGAWVLAMSTATFQFTHAATTDAAGDYTIEAVTPGEYAVIYIDPTADHAPEYHDDSPAPNGATAVTIAQDQVLDLDAALTRIAGHPVLSYTGGSPLDGSGGQFPGLQTFDGFATSVGTNVETAAALPADLSGYRCVLLNGMTDPFSPADLTTLDTYVADGGTIVTMAEGDTITGGPASQTTQNQVLDAVGAAIENVGGSHDAGFHTTTDILPGPFGTGVASIRYGNTSELTLGAGAGTVVRGEANQRLVAAQNLGAGTVVAVADMNLLSDRSNTGYHTNSNGVLARNLCG